MKKCNTWIGFKIPGKNSETSSTEAPINIFYFRLIMFGKKHIFYFYPTVSICRDQSANVANVAVVVLERHFSLPLLVENLIPEKKLEFHFHEKINYFVV